MVSSIARLSVYNLFQKWGSANGNRTHFENVRYSLETLAANGDLNYITNNGSLTKLWQHTLGESNGGHPAR